MLTSSDYKIAEQNGICKRVVNWRIRAGWAEERAITEPVNGKLYEQYKHICVVPRRTFNARIKQGMTPESAATIPPGPTSRSYQNVSSLMNEYEVRSNITAIFLKKKDGTILETIIDTDDLGKLLSFRCRLTTDNNYARIFYGYPEKKSVGLHRFLLGSPEGLVIDHINHNTLDNRRKNLRVATIAENAQNRKGAQSDSKTGIRGVYWNKSFNKWHAHLKVNKKHISAGYFDDIKEAEKAVIEARSRYHKFASKK
jgi:D-Tyr-tRNAtyr deacylase